MKISLSSLTKGWKREHIIAILGVIATMLSSGLISNIIKPNSSSGLSSASTGSQTIENSCGSSSNSTKGNSSSIICGNTFITAP